MAFLVNVFTRFKKEIETSDNQQDETLRTHYYKTNFTKLFQSVEQMFRDDADCTITTVSKEHGEIAVEVNKPFPCFLIVTVVSVKPMETAVDFNISSEKFSPFGLYPALKQRIHAYYDKLNKLYPYMNNQKNS